MNQFLGKTGANDVEFSDEDFSSLAKLAHREFGLSLSQSKKPLVYSRLSRRLKARGIDNFPSYLQLIQQDSEDSERLELISALTTNVTSFFREDHHFDTLRKSCLAEKFKDINSGERLRIWSAGCSSGQEPYSIAMTVLGEFPDAFRMDCKVLATDIDPKIVSKARSAVYTREEIETIPEERRKKWVDVGTDETYSISDNVKGLVTFAELNLIQDWPFRGPFDAIFCRNVAIYFDQSTQQVLWERFAKYLSPGGLLFIGHSERVTGPALEVLSGIGITSYQKSASPDVRLK